MAIKQISVFVENKPGRLAEITDILAKNNVSIRAFCVADTTDFGILRLIVDKTEDAKKALGDAGVTVSITEVIAVSIPDNPGEFSAIIKLLSEIGENIEYAYAFLTPEIGRAFVILRISDNDRATEYLKSKGVAVIDQKDIL